MELTLLALRNRIGAFLQRCMTYRVQSNTVEPALRDRLLLKGPPADPSKSESAKAGARSQGPSDPVAAQAVPPPYREHADSYRDTRVNVATAVINILGERADEIGPELMASVNGGMRKLPPLAGLEEVARSLLGIWAALQVADGDRSTCLHLVDRCATLLRLVCDGVAVAGDDLGSSEWLKVVINDLSFAFAEVKRFLDQHSGSWPCFRRERIRQARDCNDMLSGARDMFSMWAQNRMVWALFYGARELQELQANVNIAARHYLNDISLRGSQPAVPPPPRATADTSQARGLTPASERTAIQVRIEGQHVHVHIPDQATPQAVVVALSTGQNDSAAVDGTQGDDLRKLVQEAIDAHEDSDTISRIFTSRNVAMADAVRILLACLRGRRTARVSAEAEAGPCG